MSNFIEVESLYEDKKITYKPYPKIYINTSLIIAFSKFNEYDKDCLRIKVDRKPFERQLLPKEYILCKEDNPLAYYSMLLK